VVLRNGQYAILKSFALLEDTPGVPGLDLPGLDIVSLGKGYGAASCRAETVEDIRSCFARALTAKQVSLLEVPIDNTVHTLLGD